jgi:hypothetical protein
MESETMTPGRRKASGPGEQQLRAVVRSRARRRRAPGGSPGPAMGKAGRDNGSGSDRLQPRIDDPKPYDDDWGWWIEFRLGRIEAQIKWLVALAAGTLLAEVLRVALAALGLP